VGDGDDGLADRLRVVSGRESIWCLMMVLLRGPKLVALADTAQEYIMEYDCDYCI